MSDVEVSPLLTSVALVRHNLDDRAGTFNLLVRRAVEDSLDDGHPLGAWLLWLDKETGEERETHGNVVAVHGGWINMANHEVVPVARVLEMRF